MCGQKSNANISECNCCDDAAPKGLHSANTNNADMLAQDIKAVKICSDPEESNSCSCYSPEIVEGRPVLNVETDGPPAAGECCDSGGKLTEVFSPPASDHWHAALEGDSRAGDGMIGQDSVSDSCSCCSSTRSEKEIVAQKPSEAEVAKYVLTETDTGASIAADQAVCCRENHAKATSCCDSDDFIDCCAKAEGDEADTKRCEKIEEDCGALSTTAAQAQAQTEPSCLSPCCVPDIQEESGVELLGYSNISGLESRLLDANNPCARELVELEQPRTPTALEDACPCCVKGVIGLASSNPSQWTNLLRKLEDNIPDIETELRRCCLLFSSVLRCDRLACCFQSSLSTEARSALKTNRKKRSPPSHSEKRPATNVPNVKSSYLRQNFTVDGMDCGSCTLLLDTAASRLPAVSNVTAEYTTGTMSLSYDPERIQPEAIARYISRATGFDVTAVEDEDVDARPTSLVLPIRFATAPPQDVLVEYGTITKVDGNFRDAGAVQLRLNAPHMLTPRKVIAGLEQYGPTLLPPASPPTFHRKTRELVRIALRTFLLTLLAIPILVFAWVDFPDYLTTKLHAASLALGTLIYVGAWPIHSQALRELLFLRQVRFNLLITIGVTVAWVFSVTAFAFEVAERPFADEPFFETVALLIVLIYIGRTVQAAVRRSTGSIHQQLIKMQPRTALLIDSEDTNQVTEIDVRLLQLGDNLRILAGEPVPTDGVVISGHCEIDETMVTGESIPARKIPGSTVMAGTINIAGQVDIAIGSVPLHNSLARTMSLVQIAQNSRPPVQDLVDRVSGWILPAALSCAAVALVVWSLVGVYVRGKLAGDSIVSAINYAIAILIVSCPCALGLTIPLATTANFATSARQGVLFRSSTALHLANKINIIAFDKTGTLTTGKLAIVECCIVVPGVEPVVAVLASASNHPVAQAVWKKLSSLCEKGALDAVTLGDVEDVPGKGLVATIGGLLIKGGSENFTGMAGHADVEALKNAHLTLFTVTIGGELVAAFGLTDTPRAESAQLIEDLKARGKEVFILSGDNAGAVHDLANRINVPVDHAYYQCLPSTKEQLIADWEKSGKHVCFVGDGTNDGPALGRATISIAVSASSDIAQTAASIILLTPDIRCGVLTVLKAGAFCQIQTLLAIGWACLYNVLAILLASGILIGVHIGPQWAGLGELASILPVIMITMAAHPVSQWFARSIT